jgi:hypothetical protein
MLLYRLAAMAVVVSTLALGLSAAASVAQDRTLVLAVVDSAGRPLTDLQADDVRVREDGVDGEVVGLRRASGPLFIQFLVDTTPAMEPYVSDIRKATIAFVRRIKAGDPTAEIGVMEFGQAASPVVQMTSSLEQLENGISRIFPKPQSASVLLEAIVAASNSLMPRSGYRRAIVSFNTEPSNEQSGEAPKRMLVALGLSGAQLWSVSLQTQNRSNAARDVVLNDVTKRTGGRREIIVASSAIQGYLEAYADVLLAQHELTYRVPGGRAAKVVQTGTTRPGARVHASTLPHLSR